MSIFGDQSQYSNFEGLMWHLEHDFLECHIVSSNLLNSATSLIFWLNTLCANYLIWRRMEILLMCRDMLNILPLSIFAINCSVISWFDYKASLIKIFFVNILSWVNMLFEDGENLWLHMGYCLKGSGLYQLSFEINCGDILWLDCKASLFKCFWDCFIVGQYFIWEKCMDIFTFFV
jgi:hypothetical protein